MKLKLKTKGIIKKVALALAGVAALTAVGFGVKAIVDYTKEDLKKITPTFEVGNLGADGKYVNDESTLYTKESFACDGLKIKLAFDNEINYQIFYYDDMDNFVSSSSIMSSAFEDTVLAADARLVIVPTNDEDNKISFTERYTYPKQMTVKVAKEQKLKYANAGNTKLLVVYDQYDLEFTRCSISVASDNTVNFNTSTTNRASTSMQFLDVSKYKSISVVGNLGSGSLTFGIFEFKNTDTGAKLIKRNVETQTNVTFEKDTDFILITFKHYDGNGDAEFTDTQLLTLSQCFILK